MTTQTAPLVEKYSPTWLIAKIDARRLNFENKMIDLFGRRGGLNWLLLLFVAVVIVYLLAIAKGWLTSSPSRQHAKFLLMFPLFLANSLLALLMSRLLMPKLETALLFTSQFTALGIFYWLLRAKPQDVLIIFIGIAALFITAKAFIAWQLRMKLRSNESLITAFVMAIGLVNLLDALNFFKLSESLTSPYIAFRWILAVGFPILTAAVSAGPELRLQISNYLKFPFLFFYPLPSRLGFWIKNSSPELDARAIVDIAVSLLFLLFVALLKAALTEQLSSIDFLNIVFTGALSYLYVYFSSSAQVTIAVAIGRLAGYALPNGYDYPLLASTPQERWRRWNTYFYHFFVTTTFFPVLKKTSSIFLAVSCVFFFTALTHSAPQLVFSFVNSRNGGDSVFIFFMLHALIVYGGIKTERFWPQMTTKRGWWGVAAVFVLMSAIHILKAEI